MHFLRLLLLATLLLGFAGCRSSTEDDHFGPVQDFTLTERSGKQLGRADLQGKVWVAAFFFSRCAGPCSQISGSMAQLQHAFIMSDDLVARDPPDVVLVSFSVDPEHDTPEVLTAYADKFQADPKRWLFLTGERDKLYAFITGSFNLGVAQNEGTARTPGNEVMHSTRLVVVDRQGEKRGYFDGTDPEQMTLLKRKVTALLREKP